MQLTIDSGEPLDHVLAVVGAMYRVGLSVDRPTPTKASGTTTPAKGSRPARRTAKSAAAGKSAKGRASGRGAVDTAEVRAWARSSGVAVSDRGRISGEVLDAYRKARR